MIKVRRSSARGHFDFGWLKTYHSFSFGDYQDLAYTHFRSLRVINEDFVQEGMGFPTHGHRDMEIITFIISGELEHKDSMGTGSVIRAGEVQYMSAGSGVTHSEFNPSKKNATHLLQLWIFPNKKNLESVYAQKDFSSKMKNEGLVPLVSGNPDRGMIQIRQDAGIFHGRLKPGAKIEYKPLPGRGIWIQFFQGSASILGENLMAGDGAAIEDEKKIEIIAEQEECRFLLFDLG